MPRNEVQRPKFPALLTWIVREWDTTAEIVPVGTEIVLIDNAWYRIDTKVCVGTVDEGYRISRDWSSAQYLIVITNQKGSLTGRRLFNGDDVTICPSKVDEAPSAGERAIYFLFGDHWIPLTS